jgi:hypothetical protein
LITLGLALCALPDDPRAQNARPRIVLGPETLVSRDEDFAHVETMLAVNPTDPRHLLASSIIRPRDGTGQVLSRTRGYVSRDAGRTWKPSLLPDENLWDPVVAFTPRGTALFVCLLPPKSLSVFHSDDRGATWTDRTDLAFTDSAMIAVDWTGGKYRGRLYLAGRMGEDRTSPIVVHRSDDEGRTFETSVAVATPLAGRAFNPIVLRDGTLFVPFTTLADVKLRQIDGLRSSDGGRTFSQAFRVATRLENLNDAGDTPPAVFAAGSHAGAERLYSVFTVYRADANARLVFSRSDDGGRTWSDPREVASGVGAEFTHGAANVSVNRSGIVGISWLQRRIGPMDYERNTTFNETYDLFFTASLDGGETFRAPVRISTQSSNPAGRVVRFFPGQDYMLTETASDGTFHLLWPDARSGTFQLYARAVRIE